MKITEIITESESYRPPQLNVGDHILKGKFKNSPAEIKGFKKDKHNQPVLKTNKGDVQLFKPRVTKSMTEVDYTPGIEPLQISFEQLVASAEKVGDMDNRDVYRSESGNSQIYFTYEDTVDGLIILSDGKLHGIKNYSKIPGLITMLVGFVAHRLKQKITIEKSEPFTSNGIDWLCSLLKAGGRGLSITDQDGKFPDADLVRQEWATAMTGSNHGPTEIIIESNMSRQLQTKEQNLHEGRLLPATWFIGDETIL